MKPDKSFRLLADIGGTNARFTICENSVSNDPRAIFDFQQIIPLSCNEHFDINSAILAYLQQINRDIKNLTDVGIAIATAINGDQIIMTNHHWQFSILQLKKDLQVDNILVVNDFTALAMAIPHFQKNDYCQIGGGEIIENKAIAVIGPGTGLGASALIYSDNPTNTWVAISGEGGHVALSPINEFECEILKYCWTKYPHVSAERLISGIGLELLYEAIYHLRQPNTQNSFQRLTPKEIAEKAHNNCPIAKEVYQTFSAMFGTVCANLAITIGSQGGLYIGGGIINKIGALFDQKLFRERFEFKGRFSKYMSQIPTLLITNNFPAFLGVASMLDKKINSH